jgi:hypothetical protein
MLNARLKNNAQRSIRKSCSQSDKNSLDEVGGVHRT